MKANNIYIGVFFFAWVTIAQAQSIIAPQFGDQLAEISWQAWALVFAYGAVGTMIRLQQAIKANEVAAKATDILAWCVLGIFSAFATFGICEQINAITNSRLPDLIEGALITVGAYNHKRVIDWMTQKLERLFGADKSTETEKP